MSSLFRFLGSKLFEAKKKSNYVPKGFVIKRIIKYNKNPFVALKNDFNFASLMFAYLRQTYYANGISRFSFHSRWLRYANESMMKKIPTSLMFAQHAKKRKH